MRICNISIQDYSNFGYNISKAIRSCGVECDSFFVLPHPFGYENEGQQISIESIKKITKKYDVVQVMHSHLSIYKMVDKSKKITVWHTGTGYRQEKERLNSYFNPIVSKSFYDSSEFHNTGMKNEAYVFGCLDCSKFPYYPPKRKPYKFAHYPSNPLKKGTDIINAIAKKTRINYSHSIDKVNHVQQIKRMMDCDIYIELFMPYQKDEVYGSFGVTAIEAAAMGKVVITNNMGRDIYQKTYGDCALQICNTESELEEKILELNDMPIEELIKLQLNTMDWVRNNHDLIPTGKRILKELGLWKH